MIEVEEAVEPDNEVLWEVSVSYKCGFCSLFESRTDSLYTHSFKEHCSNTFYCHICESRTCGSIAELSFHIESQHRIKGNYSFLCPLCTSHIFSTENELKEHVVRDHWSIKPVQACTLCSYKCENNIEAHINKDHKGFKCSIFKCNFIAGDELILLKHTLSLHLPQLKLFLSCIMCDREFDKWDSARNHILNSHSINLDENLNKYIKNADAIANLVKKDNEIQERKYLKYVVQIHCQLCTYICQKRTRFLNHIDNRHSHFNIKCPFKGCNFRNSKFWTYCRHVRSKHLVRIKFVCPHCKIMFPSLQLGFKHNYAVHGKNKAFFKKAFVCTICDEEVADQVDGYSHFSYIHSINFPIEIPLLFEDNDSGFSDRQGDLLEEHSPSSLPTPTKPSINPQIGNEQVSRCAGHPQAAPRPPPRTNTPVSLPAVRPVIPSRPAGFSYTSPSSHQTTFVQASKPTVSTSYSSPQYQNTYTSNNQYNRQHGYKKKKDDCVIL